MLRGFRDRFETLFMTPTALQTPQFLNRELSWMAFNDRVLEEAQDSNYRLLDRLKFVAIVSSNLDEFFMIRIAGLERKVKSRPQSIEIDGLKTDEVLYQLRDWTLEQKAKQGTVLRELLENLKKEGLYLQATLTASARLLDFAKEKLSEVQVQIFKSSDGIEHLPSGKIFVFVRLKDKFAILSLPDHFDRLIPLPSDLAEAKCHYILAEKLMMAAASIFFKDEAVIEAFPFKMIRDADVAVDPNTDPEELLAHVEAAVQKRAKQPIVRLEVDSPSISDSALFLANTMKLHSRSIYRYDAPLDLKILWRLHGLSEFGHLRSDPIESAPLGEAIPDLVRILKAQDILLHHPYDAFDTVVQLLQAAARDSRVTEIRQTLYRTSSSSPIAEALIEAAKQKKTVSVFVELRARFDEVSNIGLVKELKKHGVKVLKGFSDKKIHCKLTQILRNEDGIVSSFVHVGTGNYNPTTAKLYTDLGLLTSDPAFGRDADKIFEGIHSGKLPKKFEAFVTAPHELHVKLIEWIENEGKRALIGDKEARIIAKVNALVDPEIIKALYKASSSGVKIDLIVRGACALRPGVTGLSENIRVISIVDQLLEHSRIYYFKNGSDPLVFLSSADWMPRNLYKRLEIAFPINDADLKVYVKETILEGYLKDNQKARQLMPDGHWIRLVPGPTEPAWRAQKVFQQLAKSKYRGTLLFERLKLKSLKMAQSSPLTPKM